MHERCRNRRCSLTPPRRSAHDSGNDLQGKPASDPLRGADRRDARFGERRDGPSYADQRAQFLKYAGAPVDSFTLPWGTTRGMRMPRLTSSFAIWTSINDAYLVKVTAAVRRPRVCERPAPDLKRA